MRATRITFRRKASKYRAIPTVVDGIRFDSKAEAYFYKHLQIKKKHGAVDYIIRQVPFDLPGGYRHRVDFMTVQTGMYGTSTINYYEVKGRDLSTGKMKRRQVEELYGIKIRVVKAVYRKGEIYCFREEKQNETYER